MSLAGVWYNQNILPTQDTPQGTLDGVNTLFTILYLPMPGTLNVYVDGLYQTPGVAYEFNTATLTITFATPPAPSAALQATYLH